MNYTDEVGNKISERDIERWASDIEEGNFSEFENLSDVIYGELRPQNVSKVIMSFQVPQSLENRIAKIAETHNCSKSDLIRGYIVEGLAREDTIV